MQETGRQVSLLSPRLIVENDEQVENCNKSTDLICELWKSPEIQIINCVINRTTDCKAMATSTIIIVMIAIFLEKLIQ